jgi:hypothetical protein
VAVLPSGSPQHRPLLPVAHLQTPISLQVRRHLTLLVGTCSSDDDDKWMELCVILQLEVSGGEGSATLSVENNIRLSTGAVHRLTYIIAGRVGWDVLVAHPIIACVANRFH